MTMYAALHIRGSVEKSRDVWGSQVCSLYRALGVRLVVSFKGFLLLVYSGIDRFVVRRRETSGSYGEQQQEASSLSRACTRPCTC